MQKFFRFILASTFIISTFGFVEQSALASPSADPHAIITEASEHAEEHSGPHIPAPKGDIIEEITIFGFHISNFNFFGLHITNTVFSTWIFMCMLFVLIGIMHIAIRTEKLPRLRAFGLDIINRIYLYAYSLLGDKKIAKNYMWLL